MEAKDQLGTDQVLCVEVLALGANFAARILSELPGHGQEGFNAAYAQATLVATRLILDVERGTSAPKLTDGNLAAVSASPPIPSENGLRQTAALPGRLDRKPFFLHLNLLSPFRPRSRDTP
jgi:hypothetical protein